MQVAECENRAALGWLAQLVGAQPARVRFPESHSRLSPGFGSNKICLSRVELQRDYDALVAYGALVVPVISRRTRSSYLCVVIGLIVYIWCVCRMVRACMYEQILQLYPDERRKKKGKEALPFLRSSSAFNLWLSGISPSPSIR